MSAFGDLLGFWDHTAVPGTVLDGWPMAAAVNAANNPVCQSWAALQAAQCTPAKIELWMMLNAFAPKLTEAQKTACAGKPWMDLS